MSNKETDILIDLDTILDTRLPVVTALDPNTAREIIKDGSYKRRIKDSFGNIAEDIFYTYYNKRNKQVLELATPAPMIKLLVDYCIQATAQLTAMMDNKIPTVYLNIYPYDLNKTECTNLILLLHNAITIKTNIEIVNFDISELTPDYVFNNIATVIKYDILDWLEYHHNTGDLTATPLKEVSCVGPMIAKGYKPTKDITQTDFDNLRYMMQPLTNLTLIQARVFSVD